MRNESRHLHNRTVVSLGAFCVSGTLILAACGDSGDDQDGQAGTEQVDSGGDVNVDSDIAELVPAEIRDTGELIIGTNAPYAPLEFYDEDNETLIGFDIDIGNAIGDVLGLDVTWENVAFDAIIPGLEAGRYDIGIAGFSIERERLDAMNFVSYYLTGGGFMVRQGSGIQVSDFDELCGYRVAVQKGTSQVDSLEEADEHCQEKGEEPITILQIPDQNAVTLTLSSERADVVSADKPLVEYVVPQTDGELCISGTYRTIHSITGIAVPKPATELLEPLQMAVNELIESGEYQRIAEKWNTGQGGDQLSDEYTKIAKPWGIGADGAIKESKIFTEPDQIRTGHKIFPEPAREGC